MNIDSGKHASLTCRLADQFHCSLFTSSVTSLDTYNHLLCSFYLYFLLKPIWYQRSTRLLPKPYHHISTMSPSTRRRPQGYTRRRKERSNSPRAFEVLPVEVCPFITLRLRYTNSAPDPTMYCWLSRRQIHHILSTHLHIDKARPWRRWRIILAHSFPRYLWSSFTSEYS